MFLILAIVCFLLVTCGLVSLGPVALLPLGLTFFAAGMLWPWSPIPARSS